MVYRKIEMMSVVLYRLVGESCTDKVVGIQIFE